MCLSMFNVKRLIFRMKFHRHCIPDTLASEYSEYNPNYIGELVVSWVEVFVAVGFLLYMKIYSVTII